MELFLRYYKGEKLRIVKKVKLQDISIELEKERINVYFSDLSDYTTSLFLYFNKITKQSTNRIEEVMKYLHKQETIILNISEEEDKDFLISIE